jgi:ribosomal protein S27E
VAEGLSSGPPPAAVAVVVSPQAAAAVGSVGPATDGAAAAAATTGPSPAPAPRVSEPVMPSAAAMVPAVAPAIAAAAGTVAPPLAAATPAALCATLTAISVAATATEAAGRGSAGTGTTGAQARGRKARAGSKKARVKSPKVQKKCEDCGLKQPHYGIPVIAVSLTLPLFQPGLGVRCPWCAKIMEAPHAVELLRCASCREVMFPPTPTEHTAAAAAAAAAGAVVAGKEIVPLPVSGEALRGGDAAAVTRENPARAAGARDKTTARWCAACSKRHPGAVLLHKPKLCEDCKLRQPHFGTPEEMKARWCEPQPPPPPPPVSTR